MKIDRKLAIIIAVAALLICGSVGTVFALKNLNPGVPVSSKVVTTSDTSDTVTETTVDSTTDTDTTTNTDTDSTSDTDETSDTDATSATDGTTDTDATTTTSKSSKKTTELSYGGKKYKLRKNMEIVLIMGIDTRQKIKDDSSTIHSSQADVLYVYALDHNNKTIQTLQINRETVANVRQIFGAGFDDEFAKMQICLAHSYGKNEKARCRNTVEAVRGLISNTPIDHYISLNMDSISILNEQVGGVTVTVPAGLEKADPAFVAGAKVTLKGNQAELFVRSRMSLDDGSNAFRMKRQEIFMTAWKKQALSKMNNDSGFAPKMILALSNYLTSDMSASKLSNIANNLKDYKDLGTLTPSGKTLEADGKDRLFKEFHVDKDDLKKKVIELFYEKA